MSWPRGFALSTLLALLVPAVLPSSHLAAQNDSRLTNAVRLAQDGMVDSARKVVARILADTPATDSIYPEVLYTAGLLAATERDRRLALRQVVVDHAQSDWADDALLQLAQLDYVAGNPGGTVLQVDQLIRDYPASQLHASAALWGARAASDRRDAVTACRLANLGLAVVRNDVELRNQLEFQRQRCQGLATMQADAARSDSIARAQADSAARARGTSARARPRPGYYVQLSAVASQSAANTEIARSRRAGYAAAVVREGGLFKIRLGPYPTRAEANQVMTQAGSRLGGKPFVVRIP